MARRALVTGGAGFIGSHVVDALLADGFDVELLDDLSSGRRENIPDGTTLHELDVASPEAARVIRDGAFDVICHLAAQIDVRKSVLDPMRDATINILGTINIAEAVKSSGRATRVVMASTGGALYGDFVTPPNDEEFPKDPESPYGIAKLSAEYYLAYYGRLHGVESAVVRFANVYGPRQDPHGEAGVVAIFCNRILGDESMTVFGDGLQTRDYVFVKDVARATVAAATRPLPPPARLDARAFNIGTGVETTVLELADALQDAAGRQVGITHAPARPGEQARSAVLIDKAREVLGWSPVASLHDGLAETYAWFAARRATTAAGGPV